MSDETDKLAAEMKNLQPSETSRKRGMDAAMAAFDMEFARESVAVTDNSVQEHTVAKKTSEPSQGFEAAPRPTSQSTHEGRVQTLGRNAMTTLSNIFNMKPRTAMMGGSCMAAFIASFVVYQAIPLDSYYDPSAETKVIITAENMPDTEPKIKTVAPVDIDAPKVTPDTTPTASNAAPEPVESAAEGKSDTVSKTASALPPAVALETNPVADSKPASTTEVKPVLTVKNDPELPSDTVIIERRILKSPARTQERIVPAIPKTVTRRRIKSPARTIDRAVPAVTKQETRRIEKEDGTFKTVTETVVVQKAGTELVTIPAEYETYTETVIVQEASTELVTIPPVYETVRETIKIGADGSTQVLKSETVSSPIAARSEGGITSVSSLLSRVRSDDALSGSREATFRPSRADSEIVVTGAKRGGYISDGAETSHFTSPPIAEPSPVMSAPVTEVSGDIPTTSRVVERIIPAVTKTVSRRVIKTPASTQERVIPAITKDVTVRVMTDDGTYKNVTKTFVIQEATTELVTVPPVYETVTETIIVKEKTIELVVLNPDGTVASRDLKVKPPKPKPLPQSGRLTAGDYDDVLNPDLYKVYLDKMLQGSLKDKDLPYVDANQRINIRVIDRLGKAVPLADISIKSADGKKMFPLRTGADGMAYLYPDFDGLKSGVKIKISVKGARSVKKTLTKKIIENGGDIVVDLNTNRQPIENLDLLLTIDATGSMSDEMRYLQSELKAIIGRVEEVNPGINIRTGLIVYRDEGDAYVVREIPFTDDIESFREKLGTQRTHGGGDMPEAMHTAMQTGLEMDWREDALKVNLLVADAPPHDQYISDTWETSLISRTEGIHIVPLAASGVDKTAEFLMRSMAHITGGRFLFLTDDSGVGNPHAEPTVDCYVVTRLDGLVTRVLSSLIKGERLEPEASDVIRTAGNYRSGICAIDSKEENLSPQNAAFKVEQ